MTIANSEILIENSIPGLVLDLDPRDVNRNGLWPAANDLIGTWKNLIKPGVYDKTQSNIAAKPQFDIDSEGIPNVSFASGSAWLEGDVIPTAGSDKFTAIIVYKSNQAGVGTIYSNGLYGVNGLEYNLSNSGSRSINFYNSAIKSDGTSGTAKEIAVIKWDSVLSTLLINGYSESITNSTAALISTSGSSKGFVGSTNSPNPDINCFEGHIYKILHYNRTLTSAEIYSLNQLLGMRYGIATNPTSV